MGSGGKRAGFETFRCMSLTCRLYDSISDVNLPDWQRILSQCGGSTFMDPRFVAAAETGMGESCSFHHAIVYDAVDAPVACANLSAIANFGRY